MKPHDKSDSLVRRVTKWVCEFVPGKAWKNKLSSESHSVEDSTSSINHDDQPLVKKLCTSSNTLINNRVYLETNPLVNVDTTKSVVKLNETTKNTPSASSNVDTFINYGALSERQQSFAQKSSLKYNQALYGDKTEHLNLFNSFGNPSPLHRNVKIPISSNNEAEDHNFTFSEPLTLEEFSLQIINETQKKNQLLTFKKTQSIIPVFCQDHQSCSKSLNQFKFNFGNKSDQQESQLKFGINAITNKHVGQFLRYRGSNAGETEKSVQQNVTTDNNKFEQSTFKFLVTNDKSEKLEVLPNKSNLFELRDTKQLEKSSHQITFGSVKTNCTNSLVDVHNNENLLHLKKNPKNKKKIKYRPINDLKIPSKVQSKKVNAAQLVNGHSHSNKKLKFDLIKPSRLFGSGSLANQDPNLSNDLTTYKFGSATIENKLLVKPPVLGTSFSNTSPVFGASN